MNKKYLKLYIIESILTFALIIFSIYSQINSFNLIGYFYDFYDFIMHQLLLVILSIFNVLFFIVNLVFIIKKKKIRVDNLTFPISYAIFFIFIVIIAILFSSRVVENMHVTYYCTFILFDYLLFNIYTFIAFKER